MEKLHKIGRRKTAVARVYLTEGKGNITVNNKELNDYFTTGTLRYKVNQPFSLTETTGTYDVKANVYGGGITGQAEAFLSIINLLSARLPSGPSLASKWVRRFSS